MAKTVKVKLTKTSYKYVKKTAKQGRVPSSGKRR